MSLDTQGHRGCRGLLPENTIPAFKKAMDIGVMTLEMDVVITKDKQVLVSHEPFLSHEICLKPDGTEISEEEEKSFNVYKMTYEEIAAFDCGSRPHSRFPDQEKMAVHKPLLKDVIDAVEAYAAETGRKEPLLYNIETKCTPATDSVFHPGPEEFAQLLLDVLTEKNILDRVTIQSFDVRTLQYIHPKLPEQSLALLIENEDSPEENLEKLGFIPAIYSPYYLLVNEHLMTLANEKGMQVIPWTLNEKEDMRNMLAFGVHGIISDYPDRLIEVLEE